MALVADDSSEVETGLPEDSNDDGSERKADPGEEVGKSADVVSHVTVELVISLRVVNEHEEDQVVDETEEQKDDQHAECLPCHVVGQLHSVDANRDAGHRQEVGPVEHGQHSQTQVDQQHGSHKLLPWYFVVALLLGHIRCEFVKFRLHFFLLLVVAMVALALFLELEGFPGDNSLLNVLHSLVQETEGRLQLSDVQLDLFFGGDDVLDFGLLLLNLALKSGHVLLDQLNDNGQLGTVLHASLGQDGVGLVQGERVMADLIE